MLFLISFYCSPINGIRTRSLVLTKNTKLSDINDHRKTIFRYCFIDRVHITQTG